MNRPIDIMRENDKVIFAPLEGTANDIVFWRNNDTQDAHWPAPKSGGNPLVPYKVPPCTDRRQPPTSDGFPLILSDSEPEKLQYICQIEGHESEAGEITIYPAPEIDDADLPAGVVNVPYEAELAAMDGKPPYTWSVIDGNLPSGLTLSGNKIGGTPKNADTFTFTLQVADALGTFVTADKSISISAQ